MGSAVRTRQVLQRRSPRFFLTRDGSQYWSLCLRSAPIRTPFAGLSNGSEVEALAAKFFDKRDALAGVINNPGMSKARDTFAPAGDDPCVDINARRIT